MGTQPRNALDRAATLKAARRAELEEQEAARLAAEAADERQRAERLDADLGAALLAAGADWLREHMVSWEYRPNRSAAEFRFEVPGHRAIYLRLRRLTCDPDSWTIGTGRSERDPYPWAANLPNSHSSHHLLADALIAAEIEGWEPPAQAGPVITQAAQRKADECWPLVFAHGMPLKVALAFVEEETDGDVPAALGALLATVSIWVRNTRLRNEYGTFAHDETDTIAQAVLDCDFTKALETADGLRRRLFLLEQQGIVDEMHAPLLDWTADVNRGVGLCADLYAAAQPAAQPEDE